MNERVVQLVRMLMQAFPADMRRSVQDEDAEGHAAFMQRACYSTTQLETMLNDPDLVNAICRANEGEPMWTLSVFNFLLGWLT